jgi:hypothetical protein
MALCVCCIQNRLGDVQGTRRWEFLFEEISGKQCIQVLVELFPGLVARHPSQLELRILIKIE